MNLYQILNVRGMVIGSATGNTPEAAVALWNKANKASKEVAVEAFQK